MDSRQQHTVVMSALVMLAQIYQTGGQSLDQMLAAGASDPHVLLSQYRSCLAAAAATSATTPSATESEEAFLATESHGPNIPDYLSPVSIVHAFRMSLQTGPLSQAHSSLRSAIDSVVIPGLVSSSAASSGSGSQDTPSQLSASADLFLRCHVIQPLLCSFSKSQRATNPLSEFCAEAQSFKSDVRLHNEWWAAVAAAMDWRPCLHLPLVMRKQSARFVLVSLIEATMQRLVNDELQSPTRAVCNAPPIDDVEQEKLYWISGYLIQLLQLAEIKSKANPDNANWHYIIALNALRVPRAFRHLMPSVAVRFQLAMDRGGDLTYASSAFFGWLLKLEKIVRSYLCAETVTEDSAVRLESDVLSNLSLREELYSLIRHHYKAQCVHAKLEHNVLPVAALNLVFARMVAEYVRLRLREFRRYVAGKLKLQKHEESLRRKLKVLSAKGNNPKSQVQAKPAFTFTMDVLQQSGSRGFHAALFAQLSVHGRGVLMASFAESDRKAKLLALCRAYGQTLPARAGLKKLVDVAYQAVMQCRNPDDVQSRFLRQVVGGSVAQPAAATPAPAALAHS